MSKGIPKVVLSFYGDHWEAEVNPSRISQRFAKFGELIEDDPDLLRKVYRLKPEQVNIRLGAKKKRQYTEEQLEKMREAARQRFGKKGAQE